MEENKKVQNKKTQKAQKAPREEFPVPAGNVFDDETKLSLKTVPSRLMNSPSHITAAMVRKNKGKTMDNLVIYKIHVDLSYEIETYGFSIEEAAARMRPIWEELAKNGICWLNPEWMPKEPKGMTSRNIFAKLGNVAAAEYLISEYGGQIAAVVNGCCRD